jgi:hypothetical protein
MEFPSSERDSNPDRARVKQSRGSFLETNQMSRGHGTLHENAELRIHHEVVFSREMHLQQDV